MNHQEESAEQSMDQSIDRSIDQLLHILGNAPVPAGIEQRVHVRLAQRTALRKSSTSLFRRSVRAMWLPQPSVVLAVGVAVLGAGYFFHLEQARPGSAVSEPRPEVYPQTVAVKPALPGLTLSHGRAAASAMRISSPDSESLLSFESDPDAIARAETFAPSHPAPPLPLTAQETLLVQATRKGQPLEVAELDIVHGSAVSALAIARERANVREYVHGLLGPLATAQLLTPSSPMPDETVSVVTPEPPTSR